MDLIYEAFTTGFSDYIVKMDISQENFVRRFFGPEGNQLEHSFIAMSEDKPVGVILGGIKNYEGILTMRCGALALNPELRGQGVSHSLFALHKEVAIQNHCKQLFLEVIVGNERAIKFYEKVGYEKIYDLKYFSLQEFSRLQTHPPEVHMENLDFDQFELAVKKKNYMHINWQNDLDYIRLVENTACYGAFVGNVLAGCLCASQTGRIHYIFVTKEYRGRGLGIALLNHTHKSIRPIQLSIVIPNNSLLEGFVRKVGFTRDSISQNEMYQFL